MDYNKFVKAYKPSDVRNLQFKVLLDPYHKFKYVPTALWYHTYFSYLPFSVYDLHILQGQIPTEIENRDILLQEMWDTITEKLQKQLENRYGDLLFIEKLMDREVILDLKMQIANVEEMCREAILDLKMQTGNGQEMYLDTFFQYLTFKNKEVATTLLGQGQVDKRDTIILDALNEISITKDIELNGVGYVDRVYEQLGEMFSHAVLNPLEEFSKILISSFYDLVVNERRLMISDKILASYLDRYIAIVKGIAMDKQFKDIDLGKQLQGIVNSRLLVKISEILHTDKLKEVYTKSRNSPDMPLDALIQADVLKEVECMKENKFGIRYTKELELLGLLELQRQEILISIFRTMDKLEINGLLKQGELVENMALKKGLDDATHISIDRAQHILFLRERAFIVRREDELILFRNPLIPGKMMDDYMGLAKYLKEMLDMKQQFNIVKQFRDVGIDSKQQSGAMEKDYRTKEIGLVTEYTLGEREYLYMDLDKLMDLFKDEETNGLRDTLLHDPLIIDRIARIKESCLSNLRTIEHKSEREITPLNTIINLFKDSRNIEVLMQENLSERYSKEVQMSWQIFLDRLLQNFRIIEMETADSVERHHYTMDDVIMGIRDAQHESVIIKGSKALENDLKDLFVKFGFIFARLVRTWSMLPGDVGPWDDILIPDNEWDYVNNPIGDYVTNPLEGQHKGRTPIVVSVNIIVNMIEFMKMIVQSNTEVYAGCNPEQGIIAFIYTLYEWLNNQDSDDPLYGTDRDDYWRVFRLVRWYAESELLNVPEEDKGRTKALTYINKIISHLYTYYTQHHGHDALEWGKVKGSRRREIDDNPEILKRENFDYKYEPRPK